MRRANLAGARVVVERRETAERAQAIDLSRQDFRAYNLEALQRPSSFSPLTAVTGAACVRHVPVARWRRREPRGQPPKNKKAEPPVARPRNARPSVCSASPGTSYCCASTAVRFPVRPGAKRPERKPHTSHHRVIARCSRNSLSALMSRNQGCRRRDCGRSPPGSPDSSVRASRLWRS